MFDRVCIDGVDIYAAFGVFVSFEGNKDLMTYAPLKSIDTVSWPDEDGIVADLSTPVLDTHKVSLLFSAHRRGGIDADLGGLIALLSKGGYHTFEFLSLGVSRTLRLTNQPRLELFQTLRFFTLEFADDFPIPANYTYLAPVDRYGVKAGGYEFDGVDLSAYGVVVLDGLAEVNKSPVVKANLLIADARSHGAIYDGQEVYFEPKDVTLKCFMRANNLVDFWRNYYALIYDLVRPGERELYVDEFGEEYPCYYKSSASTEFIATPNKIWWEFSLTIVFTSFRVGETTYILASEADELIMTEDGQSIIDLTE